jgi:hypothetical protein
MTPGVAQIVGWIWKVERCDNGLFFWKGIVAEEVPEIMFRWTCVNGRLEGRFLVVRPN